MQKAEVAWRDNRGVETRSLGWIFDDSGSYVLLAQSVTQDGEPADVKPIPHELIFGIQWI